jgi:glutaredoxin
VALGCAIAWTLLGFGHGVPVALAVLVVSAVGALRVSPLRISGHEPLQAVRRVARLDNTVVVLWRPGCPYSAALRRRATREGLDVHWVNIWRDEDAHELCCSINGGSEETPTAMLFDPSLAGPVVIPASVPGIREAITTGLARGRGPHRRAHL